MIVNAHIYVKMWIRGHNYTTKINYVLLKHYKRLRSYAP